MNVINSCIYLKKDYLGLGDGLVDKVLVCNPKDLGSDPSIRKTKEQGLTAETPLGHIEETGRSKGARWPDNVVSR